MIIMENGQGNASALDLLDHCCQLVADTYGKPDSSEWTNGDFIRLSHILYKKTQVQISPNTLKRIFGKIKTDARYYPQKATRDALAQYVGFADWDRFTLSQPKPQPASPTQRPQDPPVALPPVEVAAVQLHAPKSSARTILLAVFALMMMAFAGWMGFVVWLGEMPSDFRN